MSALDRQPFASAGIGERAVGHLVGTALVWLSRRALERGDYHEAAHCAAQLVHGNSSHDERHPCRLSAGDLSWVIRESA